MDNLGLFFLIFGLSGTSENLDRLMIFGSEYLIYLTIILVFYLGLKGKVAEKKAFLLIILSIPISILIIKGIHIFIFEPRPYVAYDFSPLVYAKDDASFPSRHTVIMTVLSLPYLYFKSKWAPFFLFSLVWVGISRVFAGVHFPIDIAGGLGVGIVTLVIGLQFKKLLKLSFFG